MSSTQGNKQPDDNYVTPTSAVAAILPRLMLHEPTCWIDPGCGAGAIGIALAIRLQAPRIIGIELNPERAEQARTRGAVYEHVIGADFLSHEWGSHYTPGWLRDYAGARPCVLGNPPFTYAREFIDRSIEIFDGRAIVCQLLRIAFRASAKRRAWWQTRPADCDVLSTRPSFCTSFKCKQCKAPEESGRMKALKVVLGAGVKEHACPVCAQPMGRTDTDSADYAWMTWGPGARGRIDTL